MNWNKPTILNRIRQIMGYFGDNQSAFAERIGLDKANFSKIMSGQRPIKEGVANKIVLATKVRKEWLLDDEGDPFLSKDEYFERFGSEQPADYRKLNSAEFSGAGPKLEVTVEHKKRKTQTQKTTPGDGFRMVPVYNFDVVGGLQAWNNVVDSPEYIERYLPFAGAKRGDICVHVTGNSMMPTYSSGSVLLVRRVEGWREYFGYGHCYVLLLNDGRRILKEIQKSEKSAEKFVLCVSHNPKNPPEELPRDFIHDVYKVIMTLTNEGF